MVPRFALAAIVLAVFPLGIHAESSHTPRKASVVGQAGTQTPPNDIAKKDWFDRTITDILEGRVPDIGDDSPKPKPAR